MSETEFIQENSLNSEMEADEVPLKKLCRYLGKLLIMLKLTGIPIIEGKNGNRRENMLDSLQKLCYPIFIHLTLLYLWCAAISSKVLDYATITDMVPPVLPCVMWLLMRRQIIPLRQFLADLSNTTSMNFTSHNICLLCSIDTATYFTFIFPAWLIAVRTLQNNNMINWIDVFRVLQETLFPSVMVITYTSISYLLLQNMRFYKNMFHKRLNRTSSMGIKSVMEDYLKITKIVERFQNLLCHIAFVIVLHNFCVLAFLVMDMMYAVNWMPTRLIQSLSELIFIFVSIELITLCEGNISLEMATIKSILLEKMLTKADQDSTFNNEKCIDLILKKNVSALTASIVFFFERRFFLKVIATVIAEVVAIYVLVLASFHIYVN